MHKPQAFGEQHRGMRRKVSVPDVEGGQFGGAGSPRSPLSPCGFQQRRTLPQHAVVVGAVRGEPRQSGCAQLVHEPSALAGITAHQRKILGREEHRLENAENLARPADRRAVDLGAIGGALIQFQIDAELPARVHDGGADSGAFGPEPDQRRVRGDPVRAECGQIADRLEQVGLAVAVGSEENRSAWG